MFQLSQTCDVHLDGQGNGHSYDRRHYVINKSTIRVTNKIKTRSLTGSVNASANSEAKYSCVVVAIRSSKRWEAFCVWREDSDETSRGIVQRRYTSYKDKKKAKQSKINTFFTVSLLFLCHALCRELTLTTFGQEHQSYSSKHQHKSFRLC